MFNFKTICACLCITQFSMHKCICMHKCTSTCTSICLGTVWSRPDFGPKPLSKLIFNIFTKVLHFIPYFSVISSVVIFWSLWKSNFGPKSGPRQGRISVQNLIENGFLYFWPKFIKCLCRFIQYTAVKKSKSIFNQILDRNPALSGPDFGPKPLSKLIFNIFTKVLHFIPYFSVISSVVIFWSLWKSNFGPKSGPRQGRISVQNLIENGFLYFWPKFIKCLCRFIQYTAVKKSKSIFNQILDRNPALGGPDFGPKHRKTPESVFP